MNSFENHLATETVYESGKTMVHFPILNSIAIIIATYRSSFKHLVILNIT